MQTDPQHTSAETISALLRDSEPPQSPQHLDQLILAQAAATAQQNKASRGDAKRWYSSNWVPGVVAFSMAGIALSVVLRAPVNEISNEYAREEFFVEGLANDSAVTSLSTAPLPAQSAVAPLRRSAATASSPPQDARVADLQQQGIAQEDFSSRAPVAVAEVATTLLELPDIEAIEADSAEFEAQVTDDFPSTATASAASLSYLNAENLSKLSVGSLGSLFTMLERIEGLAANTLGPATLRAARAAPANVAENSEADFSVRAAQLLQGIQQADDLLLLQQRYEQQREVFSWNENLMLPLSLSELITLLQRP